MCLKGNLNFFFIVQKIDDILLIDNTKAIPSVGETISSATAVAEVTYVHTTGDNRSLIYVKDANGLFETTGTLFVGAIFGNVSKIF